MVELDPNTSLVVSFDLKTVSVDPLTGSITNLRPVENINVSTITGSLSLKQGESASAQGNDKYDRKDPDGRCTQDTNKDGKIDCGAGWLGTPAGIATIVIGAAVGLGVGIYVFTQGGKPKSKLIRFSTSVFFDSRSPGPSYFRADLGDFCALTYGAL